MIERTATRPGFTRSSPARAVANGAWRCAGVVLIAVIAALLTWRAAAAADGDRMIVVLDGSGSMWGGLEGTTRGKLGFVRDALGAAVERYDAQAAIGLITFGARTGGSCQSVEAPVAPAPGSLATVLEALGRFNPQGRGPIVLGLEWARDLVSKAPGRSQILLIHDGDDNCGGDLCRFANAFAQSVPGVKVNALSLGLKASERDGVSCLTKATGGMWVEAENADDVSDGLERIIAGLARGRSAPPSMTSPGETRRAPAAQAGQRAPSAAAPAVTSPAIARAPAAAAGEATVQLEAILKATGVTVPSGVRWRVQAVGDSGDDAFVRRFQRPTVAVNLAPGRYEVTLETELTRESRTITVKGGETQTVSFALEGGFLDIKAVARPAAAKGPTIATLETLSPANTPGPAIWSGALEDASGFLIKPGRYRITVGDGLAHAVRTIDLKDGEARAMAIEPASASLRVRVDGLDEKQLADAVVEVAADDPTAPGGRRPVARSAAQEASFHLAPGTYHVTLDVFGDTNTAVVVLPGGETVDARIGIEQMGLTVSSRLGAKGEVLGDDVRYRLWRADALDTPLRVSRAGAPTFYLVPGKYRIESRIGQQNAVMVREFEIGRQRYGKLALTHEAGRVSFRLEDDSEITDSNAFWELRDQNQRLVWRTIAASPVMTLTAGLYSVRVGTAQRSLAAKFAVVAGHDQTVVLGEE